MSLELAARAFASGNFPAVIGHAHNAIVADKTNAAEAFSYMGVACMHMEQFQNAVTLLTRASDMDPDNARYRASLCAAMREVHDLFGSILQGRRSIALDPKQSSFHLNLAVSYTMSDQHDDARREILQALVLDPNSIDAHVTLGEHLLLTGEWSSGWRERSAWIVKRPGNAAKVPPLPSIRWNGMRMPGETIVVICDEGYGDAIQYARFLPMVALQCAKVILVGPPELELLRDVSGVSDYITCFDDLPEHAAHCRIAALPTFFLCPFVGRSYVPSDKSTPPSPKDVRVGLCWRGRNNPRGRSMPFEIMVDVVKECLPATFVCLQQDVTEEELSMLPMEVPALPTFRATSSVMDGLDMVLTVDSAVVHLAGAKGKKTLVCLSKNNDWRWGLAESGKAPWYPTVHMIRQDKMGDWSTIKEKVREAHLTLAQ